MRNSIWIILTIVTVFTAISLLSSFHQTAREEQLKQQHRSMVDFQRIMELAQQGDTEALEQYVYDKYGEKDYCICVPWSEKMIKGMGKDVYHGTKKVYKSLGGI